MDNRNCCKLKEYSKKDISDITRTQKADSRRAPIPNKIKSLYLGLVAIETFMNQHKEYENQNLLWNLYRLSESCPRVLLPAIVEYIGHCYNYLYEEGGQRVLRKEKPGYDFDIIASKNFNDLCVHGDRRNPSYNMAEIDKFIAETAFPELTDDMAVNARGHDKSSSLNFYRKEILEKLNQLAGEIKKIIDNPPESNIISSIPDLIAHIENCEKDHTGDVGETVIVGALAIGNSGKFISELSSYLEGLDETDKLCSIAVLSYMAGMMYQENSSATVENFIVYTKRSSLYRLDRKMFDGLYGCCHESENEQKLRNIPIRELLRSLTNTIMISKDSKIDYVQAVKDVYDSLEKEGVEPPANASLQLPLF